MKIIPVATTVVLTPDERQVLEALAGSRKSEAGVLRDCSRSRMGAGDGFKMAGPLCQRQDGGSERDR
jgi:hypothetical protein